MQRHGFDGNTDLYQAKTQKNKMLFLYSSVNNTGYFHLHTGKICIKELKSINCKLSHVFICLKLLNVIDPDTIINCIRFDLINIVNKFCILNGIDKNI